MKKKKEIEEEPKEPKGQTFSAEHSFALDSYARQFLWPYKIIKEIERPQEGDGHLMVSS